MQELRYETVHFLVGLENLSWKEFLKDEIELAKQINVGRDSHKQELRHVLQHGLFILLLVGHLSLKEHCLPSIFQPLY